MFKPRASPAPEPLSKGSNVSQSTAQLNVSTIAEIVNFVEDSGVDARCIDPQEILDHIEAQATAQIATDNDESRWTPEQEAEWDAARKAAQDTDCGHAACDGLGHDELAPPEKWRHRTQSTTLLDGDVEIELHSFPGGLMGYVFMEHDAEYSADGLRELADSLESMPATLRAFAAKLNAVVNL